MFRFPETPTGKLHVALALAGCLIVLLWPLTPALADDALLVRGGAAVLTLIVCVFAFLLRRRLRPLWRTLIGTSSILAAVALLVQHVGALPVCIGDYNGEMLVIGREYTATGRLYAAGSPGEDISDVLLAAGGRPDRYWTSESIANCRFWVSWGGVITVPLFALALAVLSAGRFGALAAPTRSSAPVSSPVPPPRPIRYDAFISYRRLDKERAEALAEALEERGFTVAIDFRDFRPNVPVLTEMERCVLESRFVLCVITANYLESGFTAEEARMTALLDTIERRHRLVPLVFERTPLPAWIQGLVGIDFTDAAQIDPVDKLEQLLKGARTTPA